MIKIVTACAVLFSTVVSAQSVSDLKGDELFGGMKARHIGPALMSGRVSDIEGHPSDKSTIYIACEDWTDESNIPDGFVLVLNTSAHQNWVNNEAYK